jgi:hypothetical protein
VPVNRKSPVLVTTLVLVLLVAACGDDDDASPDPPPSTTTAPEDTTTSVDPFTVPDEITVEYVEAVLTELEKINGDALRLAIAEGFSADVTDLLETAFEGQPLADRANVLANVNPADFEAGPPGDISVSVLSLVTATVDCVAADVLEDYTTVAPSGSPSVSVRVTLVRGDANNTGWLVRNRAVEGDEAGVVPCLGL